MTCRRGLLAAAMSTFVWTAVVSGADFSSYRQFRFGDSIEAIAKKADLNASEARLVCQRPALVQELDWRPGYAIKELGSDLDPLREAVLRFHNGELFQIVATYDRSKIEGMTESDLVEAISTTYGTATKPKSVIVYRSNYGDSAIVLGRWENPDYSYNLIRSGDQTSFALVMSSKGPAKLAEAAIVESRRLDVIDAPQRAMDAAKKKEEEERREREKARSTNRPNFRP
ncbi:MAG: hypothetical protein HY820_07245 [Acidobacteria bacterium]|nr:hypothetical protein [Acidobacteriota bacterium]